MTVLTRIFTVVAIAVLAYVVFIAKPREVFIQEPAPQVAPQVSQPQPPSPRARPKPKPLPAPLPAVNTTEPTEQPGQPIFRSLQAQPKPAQTRTVRKAPSVYEWEETFNTALMEKDRSKLPERIDAAQTALNRRLEEMKLNEGDGSPEERQAIRNAQLGINLLKEEVSEVSSNNGQRR